jgi:hypothetical protein
VELIHQVDLNRVGLAEELGLEGPNTLLEADALLETPLAKDLQALAFFAETGQGNPAVAQKTITALLSRLFAPPYHPNGLEYIPQDFWLQPAGTLLAKALARVYQDDLIRIKEASRLVHVSSATVCIALDKGDLTAFIVPTAGKRQGHRLVRRSQVLARWRERGSAHSLPPGVWDIYEHRVPEGHQIVVICNRLIVNQWVMCYGGEARNSEYPFMLLGEAVHDLSLGHPEWVGQPVSILKGRYFRRVYSQEEIQQHLQTHLALNNRTSVLQ